MSAPLDRADTAMGKTLWSRPYRRPVISVLALMTLIAFESYAIVTALPVVAADLDADDWYSFAFAATVATGLVGMVIGGNWADRSGVRRPLLVGGVLFLTGLVICTVTPAMELFLVGRLLQGLGGGIDSVVVYVVIAGVLPEHLRTRMFSLLVAAWLLPAIVGPLVTGVVVDRLGWRPVFGLVLAGSAAALAALVGVTDRTSRGHVGTAVIGTRGAWAIVACLGVVVLHVAGHLPAPWLIIAVAAAAVVVAAATHRLMPPGTLTGRPGPPRLIMVKGLLGATVAATDIYFTRFLQHELDYTPTLAGVVVAIGAIGWVTGSWIGDRTDTESPRLWLAAGLVAVGPLALLALVTGAAPVPVAVAGCVLMGVGMGMAYPLITSTALAQTAPERHGHISSALQSVEQLTTATLTAVTGVVLVTAVGGYRVSYTIIAAVALLAVIAALRNPPRRD